MMRILHSRALATGPILTSMMRVGALPVADSSDSSVVLPLIVNPHVI